MPQRYKKVDKKLDCEKKKIKKLKKLVITKKNNNFAPSKIK